MKNVVAFFLLLIFATGTVQAQKKPRVKAKRAFAHTSESGKGKNDKAHFRRETVRPVIDLKPHSLERSKTVKAGRNYKYSNGKALKPVK